MKTSMFNYILIVMLLSSVAGISESNSDAGYPFPRIFQTRMMPNDNFLIGAMQSYWDVYPVNRGNYDLAGLNITHAYINTEWDTTLHRHTPISPITGEHLFDPVPVSTIRRVIESMHTHNQSRFFWQRPKIEWLAFGQSSVYKAVQTDTDYWFYAFNSTTGIPVADYERNGGDSVLYCGESVIGNGACYVLKNLRANTEQCNSDSTASNQWVSDDECTWFIKPRIRIDPAFVNDPDNWDKLVCRIDIRGQQSELIKSIDIRARNFKKDGRTSYDGNYVDEFTFKDKYDMWNDSSTNTRKGAFGTNWGLNARGLGITDTNYNKTDIQVYWYDNCQMWIDYVKVENDVANDLLSADPDNFMHRTYDRWIEDEVNAVKEPPAGASEPAVYNFYIELFEFNNIPCMAYVNHKIDSISGGKIGLMADQLTLYENHMSWASRGNILTAGKLKRMFFDVTGFHQVFLGDPYPITASHPNNGCTFPCKEVNKQYSLIPNTLFRKTGNDILAIDTTPSVYDTWLQVLLDTTCNLYEGGGFSGWPYCPPENLGDFGYLMKHGNAISKTVDVPFIAMLQAHQWVSEGEIDREPTNEELSLMTYEAVSYGAKGIIFWQFPSFQDKAAPDCYYSYGIINENGASPRDTNVYGEAKWHNLIKIIKTLKKWGPTLMAFDTSANSYIYRYEAERRALISNSYFLDVITFKPGDIYPPCIQYPLPKGPEGTAPECNEQRYLQVATFQKKESDGSQYFMILNKRCSPYREGYEDGARYVKMSINFKSDKFSQYRKWNVVDLFNDSKVATFNTTKERYLNLGWFDPGQGKLYKICPAE